MIDLELEAEGPNHARMQLERMCSELLANPLIESVQFRIEEVEPVTGRPLVAVVVFPGSNDDRDAAWALGAVGAEPVLVWHDEQELPAGTGGGRPARRLLVRRLPPRAARSRASRR